MTTFITTMRVSTEVINAADIVKVREEATSSVRGRKTVAYLRDGETFEVMPGAEGIANACCPVIAAQPGFEFLEAWFDEETNTAACWRVPIIAWRVLVFGEPEPVTPEDNEMSSDTAIRYPNGMLTVPWDRNYDTEQEWLDAMTVVFQSKKAKAT
jgi:hypothetical protein